MASLMMFRGNDKSFSITVMVEGALKSLAGCTLWFTAKRCEADHDSQAVFQLSTDPGRGISVPVPTNGIAIAAVQPGHTAHLPNADVKLVYDWQLRDETGLVTTVEKGTLMVKATVTLTQETPLPVPVADLAILTAPALFVDPLNSTGKASDLNSGTSADAPFLTEHELGSRRRRVASVVNYGGSFPILQDTLVTYLSAPPDAIADPIAIDVIAIGSFCLSYTFAPVVTKSSTIASIPTARGGANWWSLTSTAGFVSGDLGKLLVNPTGGSCAWVVGVTAGTADTTEWVAFKTAPVNTLGAAGVAQIAPVVADAYQVVALARVKVQAMRIRHGAAPAGAFGHWPVAFQGFQFAGDPSSGFGIPDALKIVGESAGFGIDLNGAAFTQCAFEGQVYHARASNAFINCYARQPGSVAGGRLAIVAGCATQITANGSVVVIDGYAMLADGAGVVDQQCPSKSLFILGSLTSYNCHDTFICEQGSEIRIQTGFYGTGSERFAGTGNAGSVLFDLSNGSIVRKVSGQTWATIFGGIVVTDFACIDGHHSRRTALAFDLTAMTFGATPYTVTPAALDDPSQLNGYAVQPGSGTSVRNA